MFGHDYTQEEQDALDAVREREVWGSISPAGLHNDDVMYADSSKEVPKDIETIRSNLIEMEVIQLRADLARLRELLGEVVRVGGSMRNDFNQFGGGGWITIWDDLLATRIQSELKE